MSNKPKFKNLNPMQKACVDVTDLINNYIKSHPQINGMHLPVIAFVTLSIIAGSVRELNPENFEKGYLAYKDDFLPLAYKQSLERIKQYTKKQN